MINNQCSSSLEKPERVLISLGSNVGNRLHFIRNALTSLIAEEQSASLEWQSQIIDSPAEIIHEQASFLNQILIMQTTEKPIDLLNRIKRIEKQIGRIERYRYGPREIDIDILCFEKVLMDTIELTLPHPAFFEIPARNYLKRLFQQENHIVHELLDINGLSMYIPQKQLGV